MTEFKLNPIENKGKRVLTTAQLAEAYGTDSKVISYNFNHNKSRYIEGKHYYCLTGAEKRDFCNRHEIHDGSKATVFYLWTERGSLLHAKSINTDRAWEVHDFLVDNYFRVSEITSSHNEVLLQILEKIEVLERKIDALEKNSESRTDKITSAFKESVVNITNHILVPCFSSIYEIFRNI